MKLPTTKTSSGIIHPLEGSYILFDSMSDSESSDLVDSEAGLEEEDSQLLSSENDEMDNNSEIDQEEGEEEDSNGEVDDGPEELFYDDGIEDDEEDENDSSEVSENEIKLTHDELKRINLDDFSSDDEVQNR